MTKRLNGDPLTWADGYTYMSALLYGGESVTEVVEEDGGNVTKTYTKGGCLLGNGPFMDVEVIDVPECSEECRVEVKDKETGDLMCVRHTSQCQHLMHSDQAVILTLSDGSKTNPFSGLMFKPAETSAQRLAAE